MKQRIIGFDLARAYAIFGMYIVNFNFCFGNLADRGPVGSFLNLFVGNSTSIFIICAGMGLSLMTGRTNYTIEEKASLKSVVLKRSWFLFAIGLLLYNWWPGDILHFYGGYMHIAAFLLFVHKRYYLLAGTLAILIYYTLFFIIPVETSWNMNTFEYADFWTPVGFLRNTFYNGWNSIFPWLSYFMLGMWLGRVNWQDKKVKQYAFLIGLALLIIFKGLRYITEIDFYNEHRNWFYAKYWNFIMADYFPFHIPYFMITTGFALLVISICMYIGEKLPASKVISLLANTGRMTLSHYVIHLTIGMIILGLLTNKKYSGLLEDGVPTAPIYILLYAVGFFLLSVLFSFVWAKKFKNGPLETIMRKISDRRK
jgi:uncharacterized membrane protein YeiB